MRKLLVALVSIALLLPLGCDLAKETKGEAEVAGGAAAGIATTASKGTLGNYDDEGNLIEDYGGEGE